MARVSHAVIVDRRADGVEVEGEATSQQSQQAWFHDGEKIADAMFPAHLYDPFEKLDNQQ